MTVRSIRVGKTRSLVYRSVLIADAFMSSHALSGASQLSAVASQYGVQRVQEDPRSVSDIVYLHL